MSTVVVADPIKREAPDILISDLAMPGMDGHALIRQMRTLPALRRIPAIALTALEAALGDLGAEVEPGSAAGAAQRVFSAAGRAPEPVG